MQRFHFLRNLFINVSDWNTNGKSQFIFIDVLGVVISNYNLNSKFLLCNTQKLILLHIHRPFIQYVFKFEFHWYWEITSFQNHELRKRSIKFHAIIAYLIQPSYKLYCTSFSLHIYLHDFYYTLNAAITSEALLCFAEFPLWGN